MTETTEPEFKFLAALIRPGDVVIDAGANVGVPTVFFSRLVGGEGRVYAFEPVAETFSYLRRGIERLGLANVRAFNVGLSNRAGEAKMVVPEYVHGGENLYRARLQDPKGDDAAASRKVRVTLTTLDEELLPELKSLALLKCDVEGHELACMEGAAQLIGAFAPAIYIELENAPDSAGTEDEALHRWLTGMGYRCAVWDGDRLVWWSPGTIRVNYFYLREHHARRLAECGLMTASEP